MSKIDFYGESILKLSGNIQQDFNFTANYPSWDKLSVPKLRYYFHDYDFINGQCSYPIVRRPHIKVTLADEYHVLIYLTHPMFRLYANGDYNGDPIYSDGYNSTIGLRQNINPYHQTIHCIMSYLANWSSADLYAFAHRYPIFTALVKRILEYPICEKFNFSFIRGGLYIASKFSSWEASGAIAYDRPFCENDLKTVRKPFQLNLDSNFLQQINNIYEDVQSGKNIQFWDEWIQKVARAPLYPTKKCSIKYITGTACVGKTSLMKRLEHLGWTIRNRGSLGGFPGKSHSAAMVASLHGALSYELSKANVIGDRGLIDNTLWIFIMHMLNINSSDVNFAEHLCQFVESEMNEVTMKFYTSHRVLVFIDLHAQANHERMYLRRKGGDIQRSKISNYAAIQTIAYLFVALLFGWEIVCVPYDDNGKFDNNRYNEIFDKAFKFFGHAKLNVDINEEMSEQNVDDSNDENPDEHPPTKKVKISTKFLLSTVPRGDFTPNFTYAKSVGVFK